MPVCGVGLSGGGGDVRGDVRGKCGQTRMEYVCGGGGGEHAVVLRVWDVRGCVWDACGCVWMCVSLCFGG
jgi:hypothetical protein